MRKVRSTVTEGLVQGHVSVTHMGEPGLDLGLEYHTALAFVLKERRRLRMRT